MSKVHRFTDCTGFNWRLNMESRHERTTLDVGKVTCGACKQRILHVIANRDWSKLTSEETATLETASAEAMT